MTYGVNAPDIRVSAPVPFTHDDYRIYGFATPAPPSSSQQQPPLDAVIIDNYFQPTGVALHEMETQTKQEAPPIKVGLERLGTTFPSEDARMKDEVF